MLQNNAPRSFAGQPKMTHQLVDNPHLRSNLSKVEIANFLTTQVDRFAVGDRMEDDRNSVRRKIEHYNRLRPEFSDERLLRELDLMIEEARQKLEEIERRS
jgi:hypothetical protein